MVEVTRTRANFSIKFLRDSISAKQNRCLLGLRRLVWSRRIRQEWLKLANFERSKSPIKMELRQLFSKLQIERTWHLDEIGRGTMAKSVEVSRTRAKSGELARTFLRRTDDKKPMNYEGWSKSREVARTLTSNVLRISNSAKLNRCLLGLRRLVWSRG